MSPRMGLPARRTSVWLGIARLARFRIDGFEQFGHTPQAFLNSLAPLLAFPLVSGFVRMMGGAGHEALVNVLVSVIALVAPAVISYYFALAWGRDALWMRYVVAFNWCEAAMFLVAIALLLLPGTAMGADVAMWAFVLLAIALLLAYWLILNGFLARHGLRISVLRAAVLVIIVNLGTGSLVKGPWLVESLIGYLRGS
jgi:hypothetical protein